MTEPSSNILIYQGSDGKTALEVKLDHETVWLTQKQMAELFGKTVPTINEHIKNTFKEGELKEEAVIRNFRITAVDGKLYDTILYNLDVIISVGYRVKSQQGTRFRIWATQVLKDHLVKGYTLNQQRLQEQTEKLDDLRKTVTLLEQTIARQEIGTLLLKPSLLKCFLLTRLIDTFGNQALEVNLPTSAKTDREAASQAYGVSRHQELDHGANRQTAAV